MCSYITVLVFFLFTTLSLNSNALPVGDNKINDKVNYEIDVDDGKVTYESDLNDHSYSYRVKTADGSNKYESGHFEDGDLVVEGGYEYIGDNGLVYSVTYIADKNGYRPQVSFGSGTGVSAPPLTPRPPTHTTTSRPQCYPGSTDPRCPVPTTPKPIDPSVIGSLLGGGVSKRKRSH